MHNQTEIILTPPKKNNSSELTLEKNEQLVSEIVNSIIPKHQFEYNIPAISLLFFKMNLSIISATNKQTFRNPSQENMQKLQPLHAELWLKIFSELDTESIVATMLACTFFAEINNEQGIKNRLRARIRNASLERFCNKPGPLDVYALETENQYEYPIYPALLNQLTMTKNDGLVPNPKKEVYQPYDNGFIMK